MMQCVIDLHFLFCAVSCTMSRFLHAIYFLQWNMMRRFLPTIPTQRRMMSVGLYFLPIYKRSRYCQTRKARVCLCSGVTLWARDAVAEPVTQLSWSVRLKSRLFYFEEVSNVLLCHATLKYLFSARMTLPTQIPLYLLCLVDLWEMGRYRNCSNGQPLQM